MLEDLTEEEETGRNACPTVTYYERHLPHWQPPGKTIFITWRLAGSLPAGFWRGCTEKSAGKRFVAFDRALDSGRAGPMWMKNSAVAKLVSDALLHAERQRALYQMRAFVVMSNHVHLLIETIHPLQKITRLLKGYTARCANLVLGRTGRAFWQDESFDHWVRNSIELERIIRYVENNPVAAGLVSNAGDWPWSSAAKHGAETIARSK
jgi:REP element-mobilizing transposase RayT